VSALYLSNWLKARLLFNMICSAFVSSFRLYLLSGANLTEEPDARQPLFAKESNR